MRIELPEDLSVVDLGPGLQDTPRAREAAARMILRDYRRRTPERWRRLAYHEAGHVVVAWRYGHSPAWVSLMPWAFQAEARTAYEPGMHAAMPEALPVALAGVVAEGICVGFPVRLPPGDRYKAETSASVEVSKRVAWMEHTKPRGRRPSTASLIRRTRRELRDWMVEPENWRFVAGVAEALLCEKTLHAECVRVALHELPVNLAIDD